MKTANAKREENIKKMLEQLKEHVSRGLLFFFACYKRNLEHVSCVTLLPQEDQVQRVRKINAEKFQQLETAVQEKLGQAELRRIQLEQEQLEKLRSHVRLHLFIAVLFAMPLFRFCFARFCSQNNRLSKIRTESESELEVRKSGYVVQIETKLTIAEQNREKELQKKLEAAKKYVMFLFLLVCE